MIFQTIFHIHFDIKTFYKISIDYRCTFSRFLRTQVLLNPDVTGTTRKQCKRSEIQHEFRQKFVDKAKFIKGSQKRCDICHKIAENPIFVK